MDFDKESKSRIFFFVGGGGGGGGLWGGGGGGEYQYKSRHILYTRHIVVSTSSTEPYSLMKIFLTVFKIEGIVALTIKEK